MQSILHLWFGTYAADLAFDNERPIWNVTR